MIFNNIGLIDLSPELDLFLWQITGQHCDVPNLGFFFFFFFQTVSVNNVHEQYLKQCTT